MAPFRTLRRIRVPVLLLLLLPSCHRDPGREELVRLQLNDLATHLPAAERREIARGLVRAERETGIDALLLVALAEQESRFRPAARSRRGALGLLQVLPGTGRDVARRHGIPWDGSASLLRPTFNIRIGALYLAEMKERFGSWDLALTAYHRGPGAAVRVARRGLRPSSRYAARVLHRYEALSAGGRA
jgi:soluble lytic murein transglycosylase-like protein